MTQFKDLFSQQATSYARFRPTYPSALFDYLASLAPERKLAWDVGTGNGQVALELASRFEAVHATDPSAKQLASAPPHPRIEYQVGSAEKAELTDRSVDLITAGQAFHWFKQAEFFSECRRVLKPRGIVAIWTYALARIEPELDAAVIRFYSETLNGYWEPERRLVEQGYRDVTLPFEEIIPPLFEMSAEWSIEHLLGYLSTWSAYQTYLKKNGTDPLAALSDELRALWGPSPCRPVRWELALRVGRLTP